MKYIVATFLALFLFSSSIAFAAPPPWAGQPGGPGNGDDPIPENPIIVIDPGHGGVDSGSTECPGYPEKNANLDIAQKLKTILVNAGYEVFLTRENNNETKSNNDRYTLANSVGGNALVSIHLNGSTNHSVDGTQGFYGKKRKDEAFTRVVHQALVNGLSPIDDRGVTNFPSGVLLKSKMPSTLQEAVFISNTQECQKLTDGTGNRQQQIAEALATGVRDWFNK